MSIFDFNMALQLFIFILFLLGISHVMKRRLDIRKHRLFMGLAVLLQAVSIALIMGWPFSGYLSVRTSDFLDLNPVIIGSHGVSGGLAEILGVIFFIHHPRKIRRWMIITAILWILSLSLGAFFYAYYYL